MMGAVLMGVAVLWVDVALLWVDVVCFDFFIAGCLLCLLGVLFVALANGNINGHISNLPLQKQSVGMAPGLLLKMKKPFWLFILLLCWRRKLTQKSQKFQIMPLAPGMAPLLEMPLDHPHIF